MILFAAATGLRPAEWIALEKRDVDRDERVVYVRRSFTRGELKVPKTEASTRAVPLQLRALEALERIRYGANSPLLFPGERGGRLDICHLRPCQRPAQMAAGVKPIPAHVRDVRAPCRNLRRSVNAGTSKVGIEREGAETMETTVEPAEVRVALGALGRRATREPCAGQWTEPCTTPWCPRSRSERMSISARNPSDKPDSRCIGVSGTHRPQAGPRRSRRARRATTCCPARRATRRADRLPAALDPLERGAR